MTTDAPAIRIGVSACLAGDEVRYDGGHKHDRYVTGVLGRFFELVRVCPEAEAGLGTPREAMRLVGSPDAPRLVTIGTGVDLTDRLVRLSTRRVRGLARLRLDGYVLKSGSPSCGMERVKLYPEAGGPPGKAGVGLFARRLMEADPALPVEEEGRLNDPLLRESFVVRVFCHHRFREVVRRPFRPSRLVGFHARHKLLLMAHSERHMRELGRLVAEAGRRDPEAMLRQYRTGFFEGMKMRATAKKHANVLSHIAGHLRGRIDPWDARELRAVIEDYRTGILPLVVPITLLRHHIDKLDVPYVREQVYLRPHPKELMLLNHV